MSSSFAYGLAVLIFLLILVAFILWRHGRREKFTYTYELPANPKTVMAGHKIQKHVSDFVAAAAEHILSFDDVTEPARQLRGALARVSLTLNTMPPTYANYLEVYRGLSGSERAFKHTARAFSGAATAAPDADATTLQRMSASVRGVMCAVKELGAALRATPAPACTLKTKPRPV